MADEDTLLASMTRADFLRVHDQKELQDWINKFWVLVTTTIAECGVTAEVEFEEYRQLHIRIRKTIAPDFSRAESQAIAEGDWQDDLNRHNVGGNTLNHGQFTNALFELVDTWCEAAPSMLMYIEFLRMVFLNVTLLGRKKGEMHIRKVRKIKDMSCLATTLQTMKESHTELYNVEEERAERDRQMLARHRNIGMVSSEMYTDSAPGKLWVSTKALLKASIKAGIFRDDADLHTADHSSSSSSSSSSSESDDEDGPEPGGLGRTGSDQLVNEEHASFSLFNKLNSTTATAAEAASAVVEEAAFADQRDQAGQLSAQRGSSQAGEAHLHHEQLEDKMNEVSAKLASGVFTSSEELEAAILSLQVRWPADGLQIGTGGDLRYRSAGLGAEHSAMLEQLETAFAMKYAAETGTCYVPPDPATEGKRRRRGRGGSMDQDHMGGGGGGLSGSAGARRRMGGLQTWRDENWAPKQVWSPALLSQRPVDIRFAGAFAPPPDPRVVERSNGPRRRADRSQRRSGSTRLSGPGSRPVSRDGPPPLSSLPVNERARAMEAWAHLMGRADPCVTVRQKALESKRWFDLSVQPEGPRKLAPPLLPLDNQRPSTSDGSFGAGFVEHEMAPRPMSSYSNACLQVSRGGAHPMLYEEPWHRPQSAGHRQLPATSLLTESSLASDPGEPLGVEPIIFTNRMDKWFGKRAMLSPGRRGRPRAMPT